VRRAAAALIAAAALAGCGGGDDDDAARIAWQGDPRLLRPPTAADDRVLQGVVRNGSDEPVVLRARDVTLRAADGSRVAGTAVFLSGYVRPGESQNRGRQTLSGQEEERLGHVARIAPGATAPLVISWNAGAGRPERIEYPGGSLELPYS
jgi:hypothetical protein